MKRKKNYLLVLLVVLIVWAGCSKSTSGPVINPPTIQGNFMGQFTLIHENSKNGKLDTATAIITLSLTAGNSFSVSGDTTKIQYPSYGTYLVGATDGTINFTDATVTKTTNLNAAKKHLSGTFLYQYNAPNLVIYGSSDTLSYTYNLQSF